MNASHKRIRAAMGKRTIAPSRLRAPLRRPGPSQELESAWADRSTAWSEMVDANQQDRARRQRRADPLILCGHGMALRVEKGCLLIRQGFTHYPQEAVQTRYFNRDLTLPNRIIVIDGSGSITLDAVEWMSAQGVDLVRIAWNGRSDCVIGGDGRSAKAKQLLWQLGARGDAKTRLAWSRDLIVRKLRASIQTLGNVFPDSGERACERVCETLRMLQSKRPSTLKELRGLEAKAGAAYFSAWRGLALTWKATKRFPIPEHWRGYQGRPSLTSGKKAKNVNASHPLNAMLNYAYAVLEAELRIQAISQGYDPTLGVMHHGERGNSAFVFDLMEPLRPVVDAAVLRFALAQSFSGADFVIRTDGVCRLNPQLARRAAQVASVSLRTLTSFVRTI